jgi:hypothetical protein
MYIGKDELDKLFSHYLQFKAMRDNIMIQLSSVSDDQELIYSLVIGNKTLDDSPPTGICSDNTGNIATQMSQIDRSETRLSRALFTKEKLEIEAIIDDIDHVLRSVPPQKSSIVKAKHFQGLSWPEIGRGLKISGRSAKRKYDRYIIEMVPTSRITIEQYKAVMNKVMTNNDIVLL